MKKVVGLIIVMLVACSCSKSPDEKAMDRNRVASERMELLQKAASSSDPIILKQAEMIKQDIENDRQEREKEKYKPLIGLLSVAGALLSFYAALRIIRGRRRGKP